MKTNVHYVIVYSEYFRILLKNLNRLYHVGIRDCPHPSWQLMLYRWQRISQQIFMACGKMHFASYFCYCGLTAIDFGFFSRSLVEIDYTLVPVQTEANTWIFWILLITLFQLKWESNDSSGIRRWPCALFLWLYLFFFLTFV